MLPYSPLHHLLLADVGAPLVMTSGNVSDEPIAYDDADALERLGGIADLFLTHDRPIHMRTDDSVVRSLGRPARRAADAAALARVCAGEHRACRSRRRVRCWRAGAELKSTFCLAKGRRAWVGHHIGDLKNYETLRSFSEGVEHFERLFAVEPEVVAHDLHPDYLSTRYALEREGVQLVGVQHHHAHLAACLAEHGEAGPAVGRDLRRHRLRRRRHGVGRGAAGGRPRGFERAGSLSPVPLPGGERRCASRGGWPARGWRRGRGRAAPAGSRR